MFQPQMMYYELYKPVATKNSYNESVITYEYLRLCEMAITENTNSDYQNNGENVFTVTYAGITKDKDIHKGYKVGDEYIVQYVESHRLYDIVYMKEITNDGIINP